jgi:hypothetical protein
MTGYVGYKGHSFDIQFFIYFITILMVLYSRENNVIVSLADTVEDWMM